MAQGTLKGVQFTDLRGELKLRDRVFTLERLTVGLYSGEYAGSGTADLRGKIPALDFTSKLDRVKANDILSETTSIKGIVFGLLSANLRLKGQGLDAESLLASLAGEGKFSTCSTGLRRWLPSRAAGSPPPWRPTPAAAPRGRW